MRVRFDEGQDTKTYPIQWTELLDSTTETPFQSLDDLVPGTKVQAPYFEPDGKINYSLATVVSADKKKGSRLLYGKHELDETCGFLTFMNGPRSC